MDGVERKFASSPGPSSVAASDGSDHASVSSPNSGITAVLLGSTWHPTERVLFETSPGIGYQQVPLSMLGTTAGAVLSPRDPQLASRFQTTLSPGTENQLPEGHQLFGHVLPQPQGSQQEPSKRTGAEGSTPRSDGTSPPVGKSSQRAGSPTIASAASATPAAAAETDLVFGSDRVTVVSPRRGHQRIDLFPDGTVMTMSRPSSADNHRSLWQGDGVLIESVTPSGKSVVSSNPAPASAPSSPTPAQTQFVQPAPLSGRPNEFVLEPASPHGTLTSSPSYYSTPTVQTGTPWFRQTDTTAAYIHFQDMQTASTPQGSMTRIGIGIGQSSQADKSPSVPDTNPSPRSNTPMTFTSYGAGSQSYHGTPQFGVMGTPKGGQVWPQSPPSPAAGIAAAAVAPQAPAAAQGFGSEQASSPPDNPTGLFPSSPSPRPRPLGHAQQQGPLAASHCASPPPQPPPSQNFPRPHAAALFANAAATWAGTGLVGNAPPAMAAASSSAAAVSPMASSSQGPSGSGTGGAATSGPSGGVNSGTSPGDLRAKYRKTKQMLQTYVKEIETLRERLISEGRRAGVLGAQVAALQSQVDRAGDNAALLAATQAEKMIAVQSLREARERAESLQSQLSIAQAQIRGLEQQQAGMLSEFATERQRREAQFVEERQKMEAIRAEEQSQKMAYLAAFHEDREHWEAAVAEKEHILKSKYEAKIAAAKEEHLHLIAQHEAALKFARAEAHEAREDAQAVKEAANELVQRAKAQADAASSTAEAAMLEARVQLQLAEAEAAKRAKVKAQAATEAAQEAVQEAWAAARAEAEARDAALEDARRQHVEDMEAARRRHVEEMEEMRIKHVADVEELRGRHAKQMVQAEEALSRRLSEVRELRTQLADMEANRVESMASAAAKAAQLQDLELQHQSLRSVMRDRDSQLQSAQAALAAAQAAAATAQQEMAQKLQIRSQEVERLQQALEDAREATRKAMQVAADNAARLATAEARLEDVPRRTQERVEQALRQAQEAHRQQLSGAVQRVQQDAAAQLLEIQSAANEANETLTGEMEMQLEATRREVDRMTALLESRSSEIRSLRTSLDQTSQEREKLAATAAELQDMVIKVQQRMEKQEKKHAKALERAQAHREQQVAQLQEELEAIRTSVPGRVESALQAYASQLAANHQAAICTVEARAATALAAERAAAEAALKRGREEAEGELRPRLTQAEEQRRLLEARLEAAEAEAKARARVLEGAAARPPSEAEMAALRARLVEVERQVEDRRIAAQELERQLQEARRQAEEEVATLRMRLAEEGRHGAERRATVQELERQLQELRRQTDGAHSRAQQLQGVFTVLAQLGLPAHTLETVASAAAIITAASVAAPSLHVPAPLPSPLLRSWLSSSVASALTPIQGVVESPSAAAAVAAAAAATAAAAAVTAGQSAAALTPAIISSLREQLAAALLPQQHKQGPQPPLPQHQRHPQGANSPSLSDAKQSVSGEMQALRRRLHAARAEVLLYRRKLEGTSLRDLQRQLQQQRRHTGVDDDSAVARNKRHRRSRSTGLFQGRTRSRRCRGRSADGDLDLSSLALDLDSILEFDTDLDRGKGLDFNDQTLRGDGKRRSRRCYDTDPGSCSYSDDGVDHDSRYAAGRNSSGRHRAGRARRSASCSSTNTDSSVSQPCISAHGRHDRCAHRTPGSRNRGNASFRAPASATSAAGGGPVSDAMWLRVQQLALEARMARSREARCLEAARRADAVILLLHGAASRAQLLLAGAPRQQDQDLADELADALARAMRHRQHIARLTVEAEAQGLSRRGVEGEGASCAAAGLQDPAQLKEWENQQAAAAALAGQLSVARDEAAAAEKQVDALRLQLLQQAEAHAAEVATARSTAESARARASQLASQVVEARAQQQAMQREAQGLRRRLRGFMLQIRQLMDDLRQQTDLEELNNLAKAVVAATERALGLWTIREHDHVQATRRAVSDLKGEAAECRQLLQYLATAQQQATSQLAASNKVACAELGKLRERSTQELTAVKQRFEGDVRQLNEECEQLQARVTALQNDKELSEVICSSLRQQLEKELHALEDEHRARVVAEERVQAAEERLHAAVAHAVHVAEAQRDAVQAAATAAAERAISAADEREKDEAKRRAEMEARLLLQHERVSSQLQDQERRHEAALQELRDAHEAERREAVAQLDAASRWAQALQEQLLQRQGQLRQQQGELDGLRTMLHDAEQQLQDVLRELHHAQQRAEAAEAREAETRQRLAEAEAAAAEAQDAAARHLVEARVQMNAVAEVQAARNEADIARDEVGRMLMEARKELDAAVEATRAAELQVARHAEEVHAARHTAAAQSAAARVLEVQLEVARDGLRQAEARALAAESETQAERGAAAQLRHQLMETRAALADAHEAARVAAQELVETKALSEELQQEMLAAERRLDVTRAAARLHEQQLCDEQQESDRLRCQLRACQARIFELQQASAAVDIDFGRQRDSSGGTATGATAGPARGAGRGPMLDAGTEGERYDARRGSSGGSESVGASHRACQPVWEGGWHAAPTVGAQQLPVNAMPGREEETASGSATGSGWGSFPTSKASTPVTSGGGETSPQPTDVAGVHDDGPCKTGTVAVALVDTITPVPPVPHHAVRDAAPVAPPLTNNQPAEPVAADTVADSSAATQPCVAQLCSTAKSSGSCTAAPQAAPAQPPAPSVPHRRPLASHQQATGPQQHVEESLGDQVHTELQALLAEVARHCQRLPAINQVLDEMLLSESGDGDKPAPEQAWQPKTDKRPDGGCCNLDIDADGFLRSPAAAAALEHLVLVMGDALKLVAQLEAMVAEAGMGPMGDRQTVEVEAALSQHRRQLEATWDKISRAQRLIAATEEVPSLLPSPGGAGLESTESSVATGVGADWGPVGGVTSSKEPVARQCDPQSRTGSADHKENLAAALAAGAEALVGLLWPGNQVVPGGADTNNLVTVKAPAATEACAVPCGAGTAVASGIQQAQTKESEPPIASSSVESGHSSVADAMQCRSVAPAAPQALQLQPPRQPQPKQFLTSAIDAMGAAPASATAAAPTGPAKKGSADDAQPFRGFVLTWPANTSTVATRASDSGGNISAVMVAPAAARAHSEPGAGSSGNTAALATTRVELTRTILSSSLSPSSPPTSSSAPALPMPHPQQKPHPLPSQWPLATAEGHRQQLQPEPQPQPQRLSLADLVAPRQADRDWGASNAPLHAGDTTCQNSSPEPQPRPPLLLPMPLSPLKTIDVLKQPQFVPHQRPALAALTTALSAAAAAPLLPPWQQHQQQPTTDQPCLLDLATSSSIMQREDEQKWLLRESRDKGALIVNEQRVLGLQRTNSSSSIIGARRSGDGSSADGDGDRCESVRSGTSSSSSISLARGDGFPVRLVAPVRSTNLSGAGVARSGTESVVNSLWNFRRLAQKATAAAPEHRLRSSWTDGGVGLERRKGQSQPQPGTGSISLGGLEHWTDAPASASASATSTGISLANLRSTLATSANRAVPSHDGPLGSPSRPLVTDKRTFSPGRVGRYGSPTQVIGTSALPSREVSPIRTAPTSPIYQHPNAAANTTTLAAVGSTAAKVRSASASGALAELPAVASWDRPLQATSITTSSTLSILAAAPTAAAGASPAKGGAAAAAVGEQTPTSHPSWRSQVGGLEVGADHHLLIATAPGLAAVHLPPADTSSADTSTASTKSSNSNANSVAYGSSSSISGKAAATGHPRSSSGLAEQNDDGNSGSDTGVQPSATAAAVAAEAPGRAGPRDSEQQQGITPCALPSRRHTTPCVSAVTQQQQPHQQRRVVGSAPGDSGGAAGQGGDARSRGSITALLRPVDNRRGYAALHLGRFSGSGSGGGG